VPHHRRSSILPIDPSAKFVELPRDGDLGAEFVKLGAELLDLDVALAELLAHRSREGARSIAALGLARGFILIASCGLAGARGPGGGNATVSAPVTGFPALEDIHLCGRRAAFHDTRL
jgi:hypothetical protein